MKLIVDDVDEYNPTDISYAYSGYAPLSITLVQIIADKPAFISADGVDTAVKGKDGKGRVEERPRKQPIAGWSGYEETLKLLPGEVFDDVQPIEAGHENRTSCFYTLDTSSDADRLVKLSGQSLERTTTTLVFFLGGCTYTEYSQLLSTDSSPHALFANATSHLTTVCTGCFSRSRYRPVPGL